VLGKYAGYRAETAEGQQQEISVGSSQKTSECLSFSFFYCLSIIYGYRTEGEAAVGYMLEVSE
ncbi:hypothetical protein BGX34_008541, partial [Mortierella sp. NVP85]